jgi:ring-1,2-phenylacetyl-CoA epoxidase subunit PaaE
MLAFHELTLRSRTPIADDAYALTLAIPDELRQAFQFIPGQHVVARAIVNGRPLRRNYSIVSPPGAARPARGDSGLSAGTAPLTAETITLGVRVQGEMSHHLAEVLEVGGRLQVMPPGGRFHPRLDPAQAKRYAALAAGSGITPVLSIAAAILATEPRSEIVLCYANRSLARTMFLEDVLALKNLHPARVALHFIMSREPQEIGLLNGRLTAEKLDSLPGRLSTPGAVDEYFLCGPQGMIDDLPSALRARGVTAPIHLERFGVLRAGAREVASSDTDDGVPTTRVTVLMDGRRRGFTMPRNGASVLEAAERAGFELPFACRAGVCSTCRAKLIAGEASMAYNQALEESEVASGYILCCQARPLSEHIELDYDAR